MTEECRKILERAEFPLDAWKGAEMVLSYISPEKFWSLIKSKDREGRVNDPAWFLPFAKNGYVPGRRHRIVFDDAFWRAYSIAESMLDSLHPHQFEMLDSMKGDVSGFIDAIARSKVKNVPYVYAVYWGKGGKG